MHAKWGEEKSTRWYRSLITGSDNLQKELLLFTVWHVLLYNAFIVLQRR